MAEEEPSGASVLRPGNRRRRIVEAATPSDPASSSKARLLRPASSTPHRPPVRRRGFVSRLRAALLAASLALTGPTGVAQTSSVPASIQAELLAKLEGYDKGFPARAGEVAQVALLVRNGNARSELSAAEMKLALSRVERIGGLPHKEIMLPYVTASVVAQKVREGRISIVYVTPGLDGEIGKLREALSDVNVLTLGAVPAYVESGIVLGFELESGKPKILVNLEQARRQGVKFPTDLLRLMKVFR